MAIKKYTRGGTARTTRDGTAAAVLNDPVEKQARNALKEAQGVSQYFWYKNSDDSEAGAHVTEVPRKSFEKAPTGGNLLMRSNSIKIRNALIILAELTADGMTVYNNGSPVAIFGAVTSFVNGAYKIIIDTTNGFQFQYYNSLSQSYREKYRLDNTGIRSIHTLGGEGFEINSADHFEIRGPNGGINFDNGIDFNTISTGKVTVNGKDPLTVVECVEDNTTINGNSGDNIWFLYPDPSQAQSPLCIVGFNIENATNSGAHASDIYVRGAYLAGDGTPHLKVENLSASNAKIKATIYVLISNFE